MRTEIDSEKPWIRSRRDEGFSLVELMVAVGIMGSLSVMAIPAYGRYQVKAAQAEAKTTLASIHTAQELYFTEENKYAGSDNAIVRIDTGTTAGTAMKATIGITISKDSKYRCQTNCLAPLAGGAKSNKYKALLVSRQNLAGCATQLDQWCMNENKGMSNDEATDNGTCPKGDQLDGGKDC